MNNTIEKMKNFFTSVYGPLIGHDGSLEGKQYIRVFQQKEGDTKQAYFNALEGLVDYLSDPRGKDFNSYFNLATTDGQGGKTGNLVKRTALGFDFDKKKEAEGFNHKDVTERFKKIGLYYHALIDSGHGYHAYTMIEPTDDLQAVQAVQEQLGKQLKADKEALKKTQVLRAPGTLNNKEKPKPVNIIFLEQDIKRKSIKDLYERHCKVSVDNKVTSGLLQNTNIPLCIVDILTNGSSKGTRYSDLKKIVVTLRQRNKTLNEILETVKEWAVKSGFNDNLEYRAHHIYDNLKYARLDCEGCKYFAKCRGIQSDFNFPLESITMTETRARTLKESRRKGVKTMSGNALLVYGILENHNDGLFRNQIIKEITHKGTTILSPKTLTAALDNLEENGFISSTTGKRKFYKVEPIRSKIELTFTLSYAAVYEAAKGMISTEELRLYTYMRYLHNVQQREDFKALRGNLFQINQTDLAKDLGVTQGRISKMIESLLNNRMLTIYYQQPSKNNGFAINVYRLTY